MLQVPPGIQTMPGLGGAPGGAGEFVAKSARLVYPDDDRHTRVLNVRRSVTRCPQALPPPTVVFHPFGPVRYLRSNWRSGAETIATLVRRCAESVSRCSTPAADCRLEAARGRIHPGRRHAI